MISDRKQANSLADVLIIVAWQQSLVVLLFSVLRHGRLVVRQREVRLAGSSSSRWRWLLWLASELDVGLLSVDYLVLRGLRVEVDVVVVVLHLLVRGVFSLAWLLAFTSV